MQGPESLLAGLDLDEAMSCGAFSAKKKQRQPTLLAAPPACREHRTAPEPIARGADVPPENVRRLHVLTDPGTTITCVKSQTASHGKDMLTFWTSQNPQVLLRHISEEQQVQSMLSISGCVLEYYMTMWPRFTLHRVNAQRVMVKP